MTARRRSVRCCSVLHLYYRILAFLTPLWSISRAQTNTLRRGDSFRDDGGRILVSASGVFTLGFFSPGVPSNLYLGIWCYYSVFAPMWVANRDKPLPFAAGGSNLTLDNSGNLKVVEDGGSVLLVVQGVAASSALLLDSGNLVLRGAGPGQRVLWQSFDHPTDTWLPGMRLPLPRSRLTSWKSPSDPSPGEYEFRLSSEDGLSLSVWWAGIEHWNSGDLGGGQGESGDVSAPWGSHYPDAHLRFVNDSGAGEAYFVYNTTTRSYPTSLARVVMVAEGQLSLYAWSTRDKGWKVLWATPPVYKCELDPKYCGSNGFCNGTATPMCQCLPGFIPSSPSGWASGDWSEGCVRRFDTACGTGAGGGDGFLRVQVHHIPDNFQREFVDNRRGTIEACGKRCLANCSCTAYAFLSSGKNTGCFMWLGQIMGLSANGSGASGGADMYIRLAASELHNQTSAAELHNHASAGGGRKRQLFIALPIVSAALLFFFGTGLCCFLRKKRQGYEKDNGEELLLRDMGMDGAVTYKFVDVNEGGGTQRGPTIHLYSFSNVLAATDNFSDDNKLGEGGFGPVYKWVHVS